LRTKAEKNSEAVPHLHPALLALQALAPVVARAEQGAKSLEPIWANPLRLNQDSPFSLINQ
jgi:hypothetical protein